MSENGKWALGFWIMATICCGGLTFIGTSVIANDRIRASEDDKIMDKVDCRFNEINNILLSITGDLREIKAKMGISK